MNQARELGIVNRGILLWFRGRLGLGLLLLRLAADGNIQRLLRGLLRLFLKVEVFPFEADIFGVRQDVDLRLGLQKAL